ncbi:MAG: Ig-like domain-containing protein [Candidatus Bathyarchaeia archaeon]
MKRPSRKLVYALILVAVFLVSYAAAFFVISLTPYGRYSARVYSTPKTAPTEWDNSSYWGGEWAYQLIYLGPETGATNVPRDTSIMIDGPRPVAPVNVSFSPALPIAKESYVLSSGFSPPSSVQTVYPAGLLQPNTTYNVSATVAGTPSWWTFTTSSGPSQLTFVYPLASYDTWVALTVAILVTTIVFVSLFIEKRRAIVLP